MTLFPFVQFEYTHAIGPPPGRFTIRSDGPAGAAEGADRRVSPAEGGGEEPPLPTSALGTADVLVVQVRGAPGPSPRRFRAGPPVPPVGEPPAEISVTVATTILATRMFATEDAARRFFRAVSSTAEEQAPLIDQALTIVRRCVVAYRIAAADPYVPDLSPLDARAVRIGYGLATDLVRGRWTEALSAKPAPAPRLNRITKLMPVQAMAGILNGDIPALEAEDMLLCAARDLDHARFRAAAATYRAAHELLLAELAGETIASRAAPLLSKLEQRQGTAQDLAERALIDQLSERDHDLLRELVGEAGGLVDAWRYVPLGFG